MMDDGSSTICSFPWEMYSIDVGFGWWRPCPRIDYQKLDDSHFFNHERLKLLRKNLKSGVKDQLCERCWSDEKNGLKSYRQVLNQDRVPENIEQVEVDNPKIFEIKFQNFCNLKCLFCSRNCSSQWEEVQPFEDSELGSMRGNVALEASFDYLEKNMSKLRTVQVFGGEPVLHSEFPRLVEKLIQLAPEGGKNSVLAPISSFQKRSCRIFWINSTESCLLGISST
jgi:hypothetical protein